MRLIQVNNLYDRAGRRRKLIIRFSILCLGAFFLAQVIPTLADEHAKVAEVTAEISPSASPQPTETQGLNFQSPSASPSITEAPTLSPSPTPSPKIVQALASQGMTLKLPIQLDVDPRATTIQIPQFSISGPEFMLVCIASDRAILDVIGKGSLDDQSATNLYLKGDLTSNIVMSGPTILVSSALNAFGGMKVSGLGAKLSSTSVHFSFVAVDAIAKSDSLCTSVQTENSRLLTFRPITLGLGLKKGEVKL